MSSTITVGKAIEAIAPFFRLDCATQKEELRDRLMEVVETLMYEGDDNAIRKWCLQTCGPCFTYPKDMLTPLKVKIDGCVSKVWGKMYSFYQDAPRDCYDYKDGITQEPGDVYTFYDIPCEVAECGGARIVVTADLEECEGARILVQGEDEKGEPIAVKHQGFSLAGEWLDIKKGCPTFSTKRFTKITGIEKSQTNGTVRLHWAKLHDQYKDECQIKECHIEQEGLLSVYSPNEQFPCYKRGRVLGIVDNCCYQISVLGRLAPPDFYYDNDILPVKNINALRRMAQSIAAGDDNELERASFNRNLAIRSLNKERDYKDTGSEGLDYNLATAPRSIRNIQ